MVNQEERNTVLSLFKDGKRLTSSQVADLLGFNIGKSKYYLTRLKDEGLLKSHGRGQFGGYSLVVKTPRRRGAETDLKILDLLNAQGPLTSSQIADVLDMTQSAVAQRLHRLQTKGSVVGERNGPNRGYRISEKTADTFLQKASDEAVEAVKEAFDKGKKQLTTPPVEWDREEAETLKVNPYQNVRVEYVETPPSNERLRNLLSKESPFSTSIGQVNGDVTHVAVNPDMFDKVKDLPFPVGVAALALLNNDVTTARRMLELA